MTILYDSQCDFCNCFIHFFEKRKKKSVSFSKYDLRSRDARALLRQKNINFVNLNTIYLIEDDVLNKSKAVIKILSNTTFPYNTLYIFKGVPQKGTDTAYEVIAKKRYVISKLFFRSTKKPGATVR